MSGLNQAVEDYLTTRRALGFKLERQGRLLPHLVGYLERAGAATVTTELALAWATQSEGHPDESAKRLSVARGFARYLQTLDSNAEVPAADLLARQPYRTLIGLLAVTGMRVGEAIGLVRDDLDWSHRRLIIREGKFGASRELPLHPSTIDALEMYAQLRDQCWPQPKSPFFISMAGTRLIHENVHWTFRRLVRHVGLEPRSASCRPRIHDLRHTFAVNTLIDWYRSGVDVAAWMPRLSTYLGHAAPAWTYWYLSATPELLSLAAARLDQSERHPV